MAPTRLYLRTRRALQRLAYAAGHALAADEGRGRAVEAMGLRFPTAVGLAAGFDRDGCLRGVAHRLGFGSVEIGTLTADARPPRAVPGCGEPPCRAVCGISIGKRPATPWTRAEDDFLAALRRFHRAADYLALNPGRDRPAVERFIGIVREIAAARDALLRDGRGRPLPIVVKLSAAWLADGEGGRRAASFVAAGAEGLLVSAEGAASQAAALATLADVAAAVGSDACLIGVGGIASRRDALARLRAGASLVQVHRAASASGQRWIRYLGSGQPQLTRCMEIPTA